MKTRLGFFGIVCLLFSSAPCLANDIPLGSPVALAKITSISNPSQYDRNISIRFVRDCSQMFAGIVTQPVPPFSEHGASALGVLLVDNGHDCHGPVNDSVTEVFPTPDVTGYHFRPIAE